MYVSIYVLWKQVLRIKTCLFMLFLLNILLPITAITPWTWLYKKKFISKNIAHNGIALTRTQTPLFNQLIVSFNADIPDDGKLIFSGRVHYHDTDTWSLWHNMIEYSRMGCKTLYGKHDDGLTYSYVRLELPQKRYADGFQIKVEAEHNAPLSAVKMLTVSISNLSQFENERAASYKLEESVYIHEVPAWSQMTLDHPDSRVLCSPTALCAQASFISQKLFNPLDFAHGVYDYGLKVYGSWPCNTAYAFNATQGEHFFHVQRLHDFHELLSLLRKDIPVVVSVRGSLPGAPKSYPGGHLIIIVGYDAKKQLVLCHDSAVIPELHGSLLKKYPLSAFLSAWENSQRLSYITS